MASALLIGDTHIPERASAIPEPLRRVAASRRFDFILCAGDLTSGEVLEYLQSLGGDLRVVAGNMDYLPFPLSDTVVVGGVRVGLTHGTQVRPRGDVQGLVQVASHMGVGVLVTGHTHSLSVNRVVGGLGGVLLLNPGSAPGVWGGGVSSGVPSLMILDVDSSGVRVEACELGVGDLNRRVFDVARL
jgi:putative phosphoesterase